MIITEIYKNCNRSLFIKKHIIDHMCFMGKNKHWILLANYLDYTLLRDRVTSYLAGNMSFAFTPECVNVEVYMKDVKDDQLYYLGNYMLAEQVRVGENRLEIDELAENETDPTKITGGYLIQEGSQRHLPTIRA